MNIFLGKIRHARTGIPKNSRLTLIVCGLAMIVCVLSEPAPRPAVAQSAGMNAEAILDHLNMAIGWYRDTVNVDAGAGRPTDAVYLQNARAQGLQVLQLAFQSALEEAALIQEQSAAPVEATSEKASDQQKVSKAAANIAGRIEKSQSAIDALNRRIKATRGTKRRNMLNQRDALQGQLTLDKTLQDGLTKISGFMSSNENKDLAGRINTLKASVPELASTAPPGAKPATQVSQPSRAHASGLIGLASALWSQTGDLRVIDRLQSETAKLRGTAERLQSPLRDSLRTLLKQGRDIVNQPVAASETVGTRQTIQTITTQFKRVAEAARPLREEMLLLDQVSSNLLEWRKSVEKEYGQILRSFLTHVLAILVALILVVLFSAVWRHAIYRYVHEVRRRRQLLLLRRFVTGFLMAIVVILGFVSEFGSLATFAGFLTAGVAVALQTVILSVAAYFFLIGRYGVHVGDRITVSGVTGDVIDIGLVRLHLLELAGTGINLYPTGRVVVFSNSVLFQASPLFKQIPGTAYTWHEAVVALLPGADRGLVEKRLLETVNGVFALYRDDIERQHGTIERTINAKVPAPAPQGHFHFTDTGLEFIVRYPLEIGRASEVDDQIARGLTEVIDGEPALKAAVSGPTRLRSVIKG